MTHLLLIALQFASIHHNNEPTPKRTLESIQTIACRDTRTATKQMHAFERAHRSTLPDDVWETLDKCDE